MIVDHKKYFFLFTVQVSTIWIEQDKLQIRATQLRFNELWRIQRRCTMTSSI